MSKLFISFAACAFILINNIALSIIHYIFINQAHCESRPIVLLIMNFIEPFVKTNIISIDSDEFIVILFLH
jgi:hypothetical protein